MRLLVLGFGHDKAVFGNGARAESFDQLGAVEKPVHRADRKVVVGVGLNVSVVEEEDEQLFSKRERERTELSG